MTRPLIYDDMFINILKDKMQEKFLGLFKVKVQSTSFCKRLNLQKGLLICSILDIIYGIIIFSLFFSYFEYNKNNLTFLIESSLGILCLFFGIIGLDAALNLKKINSLIYKNWRITFSILYSLIEISNNFNYICLLNTDISINDDSNLNRVNPKCSGPIKLLYYLIIVLISGYITKISWSFYIRLEQSHDLLVIHGYYLEKMLHDDKAKTDKAQKYVAPSVDLNKKETVASAGIGLNKEGKEGKEFNSSSKEFTLFKNEKQLTNTGNLRDSLKRDVKENK